MHDMTNLLGHKTTLQHGSTATRADNSNMHCHKFRTLCTQSSRNHGQTHPSQHKADRTQTHPSQHKADRTQTHPSQHKADRTQTHPSQHKADRTKQLYPAAKPRV
jgi:hypothetical protein